MAEPNIVGSLFGVTPELYQQQRDLAEQKQAMAFAQQDPQTQINYGAYRTGQQLGGAFAGLMGVEDPQLIKIRQQQQVLSGLNINDPQAIAEAAQRANQMGNPQLALQLTALGDQAQVRLQQAQAQRQTSLAQLIAQRAYDPGTPERAPVLDIQEQQQMADQGTPMPENIAAVGPSFDIRRVAPQLQALGAPGFAQLKAASEAATFSKPEYKEAGGVLYEIPKFGDSGPRPVTQTARKTITIGNRVLDANTMDVLFTAPDATPAAVAEWKAFQALPRNEQQSFLQLQAAKRPSTTINMPNESERKAATLANRLNFSVDQINQAIGIDPNAAMPNTSSEIARFLTRSEIISNKLTPVQRQIVESAQLDILDAALTLGTGAAYTQAQLEGYRKSYFPQIGDKPENVASKRARLQNILQSAAIASGRAKVPTQIPASGADLSSIITAPASN
jgi:hypothetical protein